MIEQADSQLAEWIRDVLGSDEAIEISFAPPNGQAPRPRVHAYLTDMINRPVARSLQPTPLQVILRYLVTVSASDPREAHSVLGALTFAALQQSDFEVEIDPIPLELWLALGTQPQPALVVRMPLKHEQPERPVKPVREPLVLEKSALVGLEGIVLGPREMPIVGARVEVPSAQRRTRTDSHGRFRFAALPAEPSLKRLVVTAKGRRQELQWDQGIHTDQPIIITMQLEV